MFNTRAVLWPAVAVKWAAVKGQIQRLTPSASIKVVIYGILIVKLYPDCMGVSHAHILLQSSFACTTMHYKTVHLYVHKICGLHYFHLILHLRKIRKHSGCSPALKSPHHLTTEPRQAWNGAVALIHSASYFHSLPLSSRQEIHHFPLSPRQEIHHFSLTNSSIVEWDEAEDFLYSLSLTILEALIKLKLTNWLSALPCAHRTRIPSVQFY